MCDEYLFRNFKKMKRNRILLIKIVIISIISKINCIFSINRDIDCKYLTKLKKKYIIINILN
jgi:hypothetical protein